MNNIPTKNIKPLWRKVPGFRSGKPWKMFVATIFYGLFILVFIAIVSADTDTQDDTLQTAQQSAKQTTSTQQLSKPVEQPTQSPPQKQSEGLNVSRQQIVNLYSQKEIGFKFEESSPVDGQPRVMGTSPDDLAILELIGPPENLQSASIVIFIPADRQDIILKNSVYMLGLVKNVMPEWDGGSDWVVNSLEKLFEEETISTTQGNKYVELTASKELGMIILTIKAK